MTYDHLIRRIKRGEPVALRDIEEAVADKGVGFDDFAFDLSDTFVEPGAPASGDPCPHCSAGTAFVESSRRDAVDCVTRRLYCSNPDCGRFIGVQRLEGWRVPSRERAS